MTDESTPKPAIGLLLLAAGASTRMGTPKQLLVYEGQTLLRRAANAALASLCHTVVVVLGANREKVKREIADLPIELVINEQWANGMATSICTGLEHLSARANTSAVVVMLCDQPLVDSRTINALITTYRATGAPLVAAKYNDTYGVPALFSRQLYPALQTLAGAQGAKSIILANSARLVEVPAPEAAFDIDTASDYERLIIEDPQSKRPGRLAKV
jgi:molybdenum cofactor cytidylyltransferase